MIHESLWFSVINIDMATQFELSSLSSNYTGSFANFGLANRWDVNATQTGRVMLNPYTGSAHNTGVQSWLTVVRNLTQTGAGQIGQRALNNIFISPVIASGFALDNTFSGQLQGKKSNTNGEFTTFGYITVIDSNGYLKTNLATFSGNTFYNLNDFKNNTIQKSSLSGYFFGAGERLVVEMGVQAATVNTGAHKYSQRFGHLATGVDLPVNQTDLAEKNPWINFTSSINFV